MSEFRSDHSRIYAVFLQLSREYLAAGGLLQASEKGWGAAAHAAKIYADARQLSYSGHSEFNDIATEIQLESHNYAVHEWTKSANELHRNFYRDVLSGHSIAEYLNDVENFVNLVRELTGLPPIDC